MNSDEDASPFSCNLRNFYLFMHRFHIVRFVRQSLRYFRPYLWSKPSSKDRAITSLTAFKAHTVESRFLEPSVSRTSRYLEPNLVSLGFASLKLYNFTPDFSNPRFLETPDNSNQFWFPWNKLTLDNVNLRKFRNHLVRISITFTPFC